MKTRAQVQTARFLANLALLICAEALNAMFGWPFSVLQVLLAVFTFDTAAVVFGFAVGHGVGWQRIAVAEDYGAKVAEFRRDSGLPPLTVDEHEDVGS